MNRIKYRDVLYNNEQLGPYPENVLKRVSQPTNPIPGPIQRVSQLDSPFMRFRDGEFGPKVQEGFSRMSVRYPVGAAIIDLQRHLAKYRRTYNAVATERAPIPDEPRVRSRHLKCLGYFLGADLMGIGLLPQSAVYSHDREGRESEADYKFAIVFVARKHEPTLSASNGWDDIVDSCSFQVYQKLILQTEVTANYIRRLGFDASASHQQGYSTLMPQVILDAGLGEVGRMGIILNPFFGANFKAAAVLTNMELEVDGHIDFGLQEYCRKCTICAEQCPVQAIPRGGQIIHNGYSTWKLNNIACAKFCAVVNKEGTVCGRCTKVCPWHRPHMDGRDYAGWDGNLEWLHQTVDEQRERLSAAGFVGEDEYTRKWWFRLDEPNLDGKLVVAKGKNRHKICRQYPVQE